MEPNRTDAVGFSKILKDIGKFENAEGQKGLSAEGVLAKLERRWSDWANREWYYVYSKRYGWIDFSHFLTAATWQSKLFSVDKSVQSSLEKLDAAVKLVYPTNEGTKGLQAAYKLLFDVAEKRGVELAGIGNEVVQTFSREINDAAKKLKLAFQVADDWPSAFTHEDLISNQLGIEFARFIQATRKDGVKLSDYLTKFAAQQKLNLEDVPQNAPNFPLLPGDEDDWVTKRNGNTPAFAKSRAREFLKQVLKLGSLWEAAETWHLHAASQLMPLSPDFKGIGQGYPAPWYSNPKGK